MIQRLQTVYLFFGALALVAFGFFETPWNSAAASTHVWFVPSLIGLIVVNSATALWAIFLYEQRQTQRSVVVGIQVGTVALATVLYGGLYLTSELAVQTASGIDWARLTVLVLPLVAYVLFLLARRGIEYDINLVRSADRLR